MRTEGGGFTDTGDREGHLGARHTGVTARDKNGRTGSWRGTRDTVCQEGCSSHREAFSLKIF